MPYDPQSWVDGSLGGTPLSAARLQHIEDGLEAAAAIGDAALPTAGGAMSGDVAMGGHAITGLADPTNDQDAATKAHVAAQILALVAAAPGALDTLNELATALGDDPNFATTVTNALALKAPLAAPALTGAATLDGSPLQSKAEQDAAYLPGRGADEPTGGDDTGALQALLNVGNLRLRPGRTYKVKDLSVPADTILDLAGCTVLVVAGCVTGAVLLGDRAQVIGRYTIDMTAAPDKPGIYSAADHPVAGCGKVVNASSEFGCGMDLNGAASPTCTYVSTDACFFGIQARGGVTNPLIIGGTDTNGKSNTSYYGTVYLPNCTGGEIIGRKTSGSLGYGAYIGATGTTLTDCHFDGNGTTAPHFGGVLFYQAQGCKVVGGSANGNGGQGYFSDATSVKIELFGTDAIGNNIGLTPGGHGYEINSAFSKVIGCTATDTLGNTAGAGCGIYTGSSVTVSLGDYHANYGDGIRVGDGSNGAIITYNRCSNNSQAGVAEYDGVQLIGTYGGSFSGVLVQGNTCWDDQATKTQRYGVSANSDTTDNLICDNDLRNNATGAADCTTSLRTVLRNNRGENPRGVIAAPAVPASGAGNSIQNVSGYDVTAYVTADAASSCSVILGYAGGPVITALATLAVRIPANAVIGFTYTTAPTWIWCAD